jgi:hypothetical protein
MCAVKRTNALKPAERQRDQPGEERHDDGEHPPDREPEQQRNRQEQPEEDRKAAAVQIVGHDDPDRMLVHD